MSETYHLSFIVDITADFLLIAIPLFKIWRVKLDGNQRLLVLSVFSASVFTLLSTLVFSTFTFGAFNHGPSRNILLIVTAHIEVSMLSVTY